MVLGAQYMLYTAWNQAQRESFLDWFLLPSLALQILRPAKTARGASLRIVAMGALTAITCFGKPSYAVFAVMQLGVLLVDRDLVVSARTRVTRFALGGVIGSLIPIGYLFLYGDVRAWARLTFVDVPQIYRFIWAKSFQETFGEGRPHLRRRHRHGRRGAAHRSRPDARAPPRRALVIALAPLCGIVNVAVQHKGFGYHFHPLTASTHIAALVVVIMLWERCRVAPRKQTTGRLAALAVTVAYALQVANSMKGSPHERNVVDPRRPARPRSAARARSISRPSRTYDFFPWELRQAASYLRAKTSPTARVQLYGMDPYLLFLAERRSATPYIYAYDLNNDAALDGGWSNKPTEGDLYRIRLARDLHEKDLLARLRAAPPEAFVFIDKSPLISYPDAWEDFRYCCTESGKWVGAHYHPAKSFGDVHIWMRDDLPDADDESFIPGLHTK